MEKLKNLGRVLSKMEQKKIMGGNEEEDAGDCLSCYDATCGSGQKCCPNHGSTVCKCKTTYGGGLCPHFE